MTNQQDYPNIALGKYFSNYQSHLQTFVFFLSQFLTKKLNKKQENVNKTHLIFQFISWWHFKMAELILMKFILCFATSLFIHLAYFVLFWSQLSFISFCLILPLQQPSFQFTSSNQDTGGRLWQCLPFTGPSRMSLSKLLCHIICPK